MVLAIAFLRWVSNRVSRPETLYLSGDESLDVAVVKKGSKRL